MKYHIKNQISKREIRKQAKNIIPLMEMHTCVCMECYLKGTENTIRNHKCLGEMRRLNAS